MANWWDDVINWASGLGSGGNVGYRPEAGSLAPGTARGISVARENTRKAPMKVTPETDAAFRKQQADLQRLGGASALRGNIGRELAAQQPAMNEAYGFNQFMADILGITGGGGGGGVDLSGYQDLIKDVNTRRDQLNIRKWQQRKFLGDLFDAAESRAMSDRDALAAAIENQLKSDATRRSAEMGLIRGADESRFGTSNEARAALGVAAPEADLASEVAQNAVAGVGSAGSVAERDARINQAIQNQQFNAEIAGLTPMEAMATGELMRGFEDRLSALSGERAAIKAQMAQARAAARGSSGPSINEVLGAMGAYNEMFGPGEMPEAIGGQGILQKFSNADPANSRTYATIYNSVVPLLSSYSINPTTGKMMDATELANAITRDNPGLIGSGAARDFLQQLVKDYLG